MLRRGFALVAFCAILAACSAGNSNERSRDHLIAEYRALFKNWDKDHDGRLSPGETQAMVNNLIAGEARHMPTANRAQLQAQRARLTRNIAIQDANSNGYLTLNELLARPLAIFDCVDKNHDGVLSDEEISSGMKRCSSLDERRPAIAKPFDRTLAMPLEPTGRRGS